MNDKDHWNKNSYKEIFLESPGFYCRKLEKNGKNLSMTHASHGAKKAEDEDDNTEQGKSRKQT